MQSWRCGKAWCWCLAHPLEDGGYHLTRVGYYEPGERTGRSPAWAFYTEMSYCGAWGIVQWDEYEILVFHLDSCSQLGPREKIEFQRDLEFSLVEVVDRLKELVPRWAAASWVVPSASKWNS